ncbi:MAG TPA: DnaJ domain-containing protein [Polyangiaceae bacterium]|nr:DnaJ domain-containing protein [Polyangiaceae bacterium]
MGDSTTNRPATSASGTLAKTPFLHLLVYALEKKLSGSIELFAPGKRSAAILFVDGQPAKVRTSEPVAYLGRVLHDLGHLAEEELTRSLAELAKEKASRPMLHGELLLAQKLVDPVKLAAGLREQLARKLRHVAAMPGETAYAYYDGFDALRGWGGEGYGIDPVPLLWGMLIEYAPWEHVSAALERVSSRPLRLASGKDLERLGLKKEELAAAQLLSENPMCASDLASAARLNDRTARLLSYLLLVTKQVDVLPPVEGTPRTPQASPTPVTASPPSPANKATFSVRPAPSATLLPPAALAPDLAARWQEIAARAATIDRADYFMMLDIARDATHEEVESAFFGLVKRWHPDRLPPELFPVRDSCSRVFARMSEAHATLTDDEQRARYMRLLADGSGSPEMQATVAKVVEAATNFQKAEVCFRRNDLAQAETFCRKAMEDDATQPDYLAMLAWLVALKPENQSPEKTLQGIQMLERAIAMNEKCEKAYHWRGMLFKRLGKTELAVKDFKRAVDLNPRNIDAAREVRLYNIRGGRRSSKPPAQTRSTPSPPKSDESEKPGLFGRLFKKP